MPSIDCIDEIDISAPQDIVFNTVADYASWDQWVPMYQCELLNGSEIAAGVQVSHRYGPPKLTLSSFIREIDSVTPHDGLEESYIAGDLIGKGYWSFKPVAGGTRVSYHCVVRSNTFLSHVSLLLTGERGHKGVYKTLLEKLKERCETPSG